MLKENDLPILARFFLPRCARIIVVRPAGMAEKRGMVEWVSPEELAQRFGMPQPDALLINETGRDLAESVHFSVTLQQPPVLEGAKNVLATALRFFYFNNPDGTIRWFVPGNCDATTLLTLYNSPGWRGWLRSMAFKMAFAAGMKGRMAAGQFSVNGWSEAHKWSEVPRTFAVFTGTTGINRKLVVALSNGKRVTGFHKIPTTPAAEALAAHELATLSGLKKIRLRSIIVPEVRPEPEGGIWVSNIKPAKAVAAAEITPAHVEGLSEIRHQTIVYKSLQSTGFWQNIEYSLQILPSLEPTDPVNADQLLAYKKRLLPMLKEAMAGLDAGMHLPVALAHGDCTPWNGFLAAAAQGKPEKFALYDWEMAITDAPLWFDEIHYVVQGGVLLRRRDATALREELEDLSRWPAISTAALSMGADFEQSRDLYLLYMASHYLVLFLRQQQLHVQAFWLMEVWAALLEEEE